MFQKEGDELLAADVPVSVAIDFMEDLFDLFRCLTSFQKLGNLLVANASTMINVEVVESFLIVLDFELFLGICDPN